MPYVEVDVDLYSFDAQDLIDELEDRGYTVTKNKDDLVDPIDPEVLEKLIEELYRDYTAYGYTDKFKVILEEFFKDART